MAQTMSAAFFSSEVGRMEEIVQAGFDPFINLFWL